MVFSGLRGLLSSGSGSSMAMKKDLAGLSPLKEMPMSAISPIKEAAFSPKKVPTTQPMRPDSEYGTQTATQFDKSPAGMAAKKKMTGMPGFDFGSLQKMLIPMALATTMADKKADPAQQMMAMMMMMDMNGNGAEVAPPKKQDLRTY